MMIEVRVKLEKGDYNMIYNIMGHAYRAETSDQYDKIVPMAEKEVERLANYYFNLGCEYEQKQSKC